MYVEIDRVRIQYLDWGGSGPTIVFVPGGCETAHVFGDVAPLMAVRARVLGVTPRGCGGSGPAPAYDLDAQINELIGFLDALQIRRAIFAGHSSGGGKVLRLARLHPDRVERLVTFDIVYSGVPDGLEPGLSKAIAAHLGLKGPLTIDAARREFQAWELGTWSPALERNLLEITEPDGKGGVRYKPRPPGWQKAFVEDMVAGRYFDVKVSHPSLFIVADRLDHERLGQFSADTQRQLRPLAEAVAAARRTQLAAYQASGPHVEIVALAQTSHYPFVDRTKTVAEHVLRFLR